MDGLTPAAMREAAHEVGALQALSHFGGEYTRADDGRINPVVWNWDGSRTPEQFYAEFLRGMADIAYEGFVGYELCHPLPQVDDRPAGLDFVDLNARLAAEYLGGLIAAIKKAPAATV
jgi:hypothetical protein